MSLKMHGVNIRSALCLGHFSHPNQSADKHRLLHKQKSYRTNVLQLLVRMKGPESSASANSATSA